MEVDLVLRALFRIITLLTITISVLIVGAGIIGNLFPSQWVFTAFAYQCTTTNGCNRNSYIPEEIIMIDGDRRVELPLAMLQDVDLYRLISPNGQHAVQVIHGSLNINLVVYHLLERETDEYFLDGTFGRLIWLENGQGFYLSVGQTIYYYNFEEMSIGTIFTSEVDVRRFLLIPDMNYMLLQLINGNVYRLSLPSSDAPQLLITDISPNVSLQFSQNGGLAMVRDRDVVIMDIIQGEIIHTISELPGGTINSFFWSPDGRWITIYVDTESNGYTIPRSVYNIEMGSGEIFPLEASVNYGAQNIYSVVWSPDSNYVALILSHITGAMPSYVYLAYPTGEQMRLLGEGERNISANWTPNRMIFLLQKPSFVLELYMVDVTGEDYVPVLIDTQITMIAYFDRDTITCLQWFGESRRICELNLETGEARLLSSSAYNIQNFVRWDQ